MEPENFTFLQVLRIRDAELWEVKDGETFVRDKGYLYVLYSQPLDFFILRVHDQKWALDKSLNIIGTTTLLDKDTKIHTYLIPSSAGFYMIKLLDPLPGVPLDNFETILQTLANFSRRSGLEKKLASFPGHRTEGILERTAEHVKEGVLEAVGAITKAFASTEIDAHPNQRLLRSFDELKQVDSHGCPVVDISKAEIESLKNEAQDINQNHLNTELWQGFSQEEDTRSLSQGVDLLNMDEDQSQPQKERSPQTGNIDTMKDPSGRDNQGVVGTENQRLPAYEVHTTKKQVEDGLNLCSSNLECGIISHAEEDNEFGMNLMYGTELTDQQINEIQSGSRTNITSSTNVDATNTIQPSVSNDIDLLTGDTNTAKSDNWSEVSNPSLSTKGSEFEIGMGGIQKNLDIPFSSTEGGLGESSNKAPLGAQSTNATSEKQSAPIQPVDKENVGGTVTI